MGATKSKVDCPPEEETESPSQTSESTSHRTSSRNQNGHHRKVSSDRRWRQSVKDHVSSTPSPDENLLKPFTYRTRKDRLIDSLQAAGDQRNRYNSDNDDSPGPSPRSKTEVNIEKLSVAKIVENLQANLFARSGSNSSIRKADNEQGGKLSKTHNVSKKVSGRTRSNSLLDCNIPDRKNKDSCRKPKSRKQVKPTGVEEKIIETLIHPRRRRGTSAQIEPKDSSDSMAIHSKHATVSSQVPNNGKVDQKAHQKSPPPPPIDFVDTSASETETGVHTNPNSSIVPDGQDSNEESEEKPPVTTVPRELPSHLKELKLKFSNDVPRSPYEDNLDDLNNMPLEKLNTKKSAKPTNGDIDRSVKFKFTNDVPLADSLHIIASNKNGVKSAKAGEKRANKDTDPKSKDADMERYKVTSMSKTAGRSKSRKKEIDCDSKELKDANKPQKSILKNAATQPDDVIDCFTVKTEYDQSKVDKDESTNINTKRKEHRESRRARRSANKTAKTQTSSTGLMDSCAQTWPDLALQISENKKDAEIQYESAIENKAKQIMKKFSAERTSKKGSPVDRERKHERKKYRNGSTQWEDVDLLVNSSVEKVISRDKKSEKNNRQDRSKNKESRVSRKASRKSKSEGRIKNESENFYRGAHDDKADLSNDDNGPEICCMHLQVLPNESKDTKFTKKDKSKPGLELLGKNERRGRSPQLRSCRESEQSLCKRCSQTKCPSSSDRMSRTVNYATSSCRSRDLSLLSPYCSKTTIETRPPSERNSNSRFVGTKNDDLYRQMEELGLGFLRNGEWVPTDVISRTLWKNLEKCTENCQATWRRRSRSFTHTKLLMDNSGQQTAQH